MHSLRRGAVELESAFRIASLVGGEIDCISALSRPERQGALDAAGIGAASGRLGILHRSWQEVQPTERVRETAIRLLRFHELRAAEALQLAAALVASDARPSELPFVCLDERLRKAADREGFPLVPQS